VSIDCTKVRITIKPKNWKKRYEGERNCRAQLPSIHTLLNGAKSKNVKRECKIKQN